jgi:subfamily B ATP-binding cassette protein MsbA
VASVQDYERGATGEGRGTWRRVLAYARPYWGLIALVFAVTFVSSSADYVRAYLLKPLLDDVIVPHGVPGAPGDVGRWARDLLGGPAEEEPAAAEPAQPQAQGGGSGATPSPFAGSEGASIRRTFLTILAAGLLAMLVLPVTEFVGAYATAYALGRMDLDMKRDACAKLLALPLGFHHTRRRGDVYTRVVADAGHAHGALSLLFGDVVDSLIRVIVGVAFLVYVSWKLSLMSLLMGPTIFAVIYYFGGRIRDSARRRQEQSAEVTQRLLEILSGIKVIKAFRAEGAEESAYRRETRRLFKRSMGVVKQRLMSRSMVELLNQVMTFGALLVGIAVMGLWSISIGDLVAFALLSSQAYRPVKKLARNWNSLMEAEASAERFFAVMDTPVHVRDARDAVAIGPVSRSVAMRGVWFSYDGVEPVLRDVSFEARAGEVVALVGPTGAGKTTMVDLLLRFYDPDQGRIEIDGVDLRSITRDSLLAQMAVVSQEPFLFDGSIRENLRYARPDATEEEVRAAAVAAHVDEFVRDLPRGYDTEVGATGVRLSGGQRQRVTIGRAILKDPSILILDEATSSLDSKSEKLVQEAIDALLGGSRTVFVIAHRLSTIRRADRILVLEGGRITQQGSHADLIARGGLYRELLELQGLAGPFASS